MIQNSLAALVVYDYILTVPDEVAKICQKGKWAVSTWLFVVNRYLLVLCVITLQIGSSAPKNCAPLTIISLIDNTVQNITFAAFSALRIYALSGCRSDFGKFTAAVSVLGLVPVAIDLYTDSTSSFSFNSEPSRSGPLACTVNVGMSDKLYFYLQMVVSGSKMCVELIVISVTCYRLWKDVKELNRLSRAKTLSQVMLEGGILYFVVMLLLSVATVLVLILPAKSITNSVAPITSTLPPILIAHFLISLREVNEANNVSQPSQISDLHFRTQTNVSVGNMDERLRQPDTDVRFQAWDAAEQTDANTISITSNAVKGTGCCVDYVAS